VLGLQGPGLALVLQHVKEGLRDRQQLYIWATYHYRTAINSILLPLKASPYQHPYQYVQTLISMKIATFTQLFVAASLAVTGTHAALVDKDTYMKLAAPKQLDRLQSYRADKGDALTEAQGKALDLMEDVVKNYATSKLAAAEAACTAAFGKDECLKEISAVERAVDEVSSRDVLNKRVNCGCATLSDFCSGTCRLRANGCGYASCKFLHQKTAYLLS